MFSQTPRPLVDLAIHVALSENTTLHKQFKSIIVRYAENVRFPLHSLVRKHHSPEALRLLHTIYPDVHILDDHNETVAFIAAARGHVDQLRFLQTKGDVLYFQKDTSSKTMDGEILFEHIIISCKTCHILLPGFNLLHVAVYNKKLQMVKYLLQHVNKIVLMSKTGTGLLPIELACALCDVDMFQYLKQYDGYVGGCEYYAAFGNCLNLFKYFREENVTFGCISEERLSKCFKNLKTEVFAEVNNGIVVGSECLGNTLLHVATFNGSLEVVRFLIENYPDLMECRNVFGLTPMFMSVILNQTDAFQLMIHRVHEDRCLRSGFGTLFSLAGIKTLIKMTIFICPPDWTFIEIAGFFKWQHMIELVMKHTNTSYVINRIAYSKGFRLIEELGSRADVSSEFLKILCQIFKDDLRICRSILNTQEDIPLL